MENGFIPLNVRWMVLLKRFFMGSIRFNREETNGKWLRLKPGSKTKMKRFSLIYVVWVGRSIRKFLTQTHHRVFTFKLYAWILLCSYSFYFITVDAVYVRLTQLFDKLKIPYIDRINALDRVFQRNEYYFESFFYDN